MALARRPRRSVLRILLGNLVLLALLVAAAEGVASLVLAALRFEDRPDLAERRHTEYDAELGWVNLPNLGIPDMYGPRRSLHTDSRGFRGTAELESEVPAGKARIVCSGDSFTQGYGVGDEATWCHQLGVLDPRLETVNMGQGGYGLDQAFLWYRRDGAALAHQVHLLALVTEDVRRMQSDSFLGYGKPVLSLEGEELVVENVPVSRWPYRLPWLTRNLGQLSRLQVPQLVAELRRRRAAGDETARIRSKQEDARTSVVIQRMFRELRELNDERGSVPVIVHLPVVDDLDPRHSERWGDKLRIHAEGAGIPFVDLLGPLRELPRKQARQMFIAPGEVDFAYAAHHYNERGNRFIAETLLAELRELPAARRALFGAATP